MQDMTEHGLQCYFPYMLLKLLSIGSKALNIHYDHFQMHQFVHNETATRKIWSHKVRDKRKADI